MNLEPISYEPLKEVTFEELQKWWLNVVAYTLVVPKELLEDNAEKDFIEMCKRWFEDEITSV